MSIRSDVPPRFTHKVALVTGAAGGIGLAIASRLAVEGAKVAMADLKVSALEQAAESLRRRGCEVIAVPTDVADNAAMRDAVAKAQDTFGALHLAVNNAGVAGEQADIADASPDVWDQTIRINLSGVFYGLKHEASAILAAGGGAIVNISSVFGKRAMAGHAAYVASKHGVLGLSRVAGLELGPRGVRVNALCPGPFETPMTQAVDFNAMAKMVSLGRVGKPVEAAAVACFLLSDEASFINASEVYVDGGALVG